MTRTHAALTFAACGIAAAVNTYLAANPWVVWLSAVMAMLCTGFLLLEVRGEMEG